MALEIYLIFISSNGICKIFGREFIPISKAQSKNNNFFMSLHFSFIKNATIP